MEWIIFENISVIWETENFHRMFIKKFQNKAVFSSPKKFLYTINENGILILVFVVLLFNEIWKDILCLNLHK